MVKIEYMLESYSEDRIKLITTHGNFKTKICSKDLGVCLEIRTKENWKGLHKFVPLGAHLLDLVWPKFSFKKYKERYASTVGKVLYARMDDVVVLNKTEHVDMSYDLLEHELLHRWQRDQYFMFGARYLISKKFRLRREIEAYIYGYRDKIKDNTKEAFTELIVKLITGGEYFASIKRGLVEKEVRKQMEKI